MNLEPATLGTVAWRMIDSADSSLIVPRPSFQQKSPHREDEGTAYSCILTKSPFHRMHGRGLHQRMPLIFQTCAAGFCTLPILDFRFVILDFDCGNQKSTIYNLKCLPGVAEASSGRSLRLSG